MKKAIIDYISDLGLVKNYIVTKADVNMLICKGKSFSSPLFLLGDRLIRSKKPYSSFEELIKVIKNP